MSQLAGDFRYAARLLRRSPGFSIAAILCLALGIGATTAIFSVVYAVVFSPLPYREPGRLVRLYSEFPTFGNGGLHRFWISAPEFLELKQESKSWSYLDAWTSGGANLAGAAEPVRVTAAAVSGTLLESLGVRPILGRVHAPTDDVPGAPSAVVIAEGLWQRAFGRDSGIIGRTVRIDGKPSTIVGVMPPGFRFPPGEVDPPELWVPLQAENNPNRRASHFLYLLGRLRPGVSGKQAQDELSSLVNAWGALASKNSHSFHPVNHPVVTFPLHEEVVGSIRPALLMMLGAVGFVLLIACVNVANLLLARAEARQREISVRRALGAGTSGLIRQFMAEGVLLALSGAVCGVALAWVGLRAILAVGSVSIPRASEISLDARMLLFTLFVSLATGVFFGLAPLAHFSSASLNDSLKAAAGRMTSSVRANRFRAAMVSLELGLALVLLIGAGLMVAAFWKLQAVDIGLRPHNVLTMRVALPQAVYTPNARRLEFWTTLVERARTLPGVVSASMMTGMPPIRPLNANDTQIEGYVPGPGAPGHNIDYWQLAGNRYFETMGIPLIEGRYFDGRDGENAPLVVIVNQTIARVYYGNQSPLGRRVRPGSDGPWRTIVGVVADVKNAGVDRPAGTELYFPLRQTAGNGLGSAYLVLRSQGDPYALVSAARAEIAQIDPTLPVSAVLSMDDVVSSAKARPRFLALLLTIFTGLALVLAAVGIYGVVSYSVAQRTGEFGIRMAVGADPQNVLKLVLRQGLTLGIAGVLLGAVGAAALTRFLKGLLYGVDTLDPLTFVTMAAALLAVTLLACYMPARRASKVDPLVALRYE